MMLLAKEVVPRLPAVATDAGAPGAGGLTA